MKMVNNRITLGTIKPGHSAIVSGLEAGCGMRGRLESMGIFNGCRIMVLRNSSHGPLLISNGDCRLAIGRHMADKIMVISDENELETGAA